MNGLHIHKYHCIYKKPNERAFLILKHDQKLQATSYSRSERLYNASTLVFTAPFVNKQTMEKRNVIIGFDSYDQASHLIKLCNLNSGDADSGDVEEYKISDLIHYSNVVSTPLVIVANAYCPLDSKKDVIFDIYYKPESRPVELIIPDYFE